MKIKEIRELADSELNARIAEDIERLEHLRFRHAIAQLENPLEMRALRRDIARFKTVLNERIAQPAAAEE